VLDPYESGGSATQVGSGGYLKPEGNTREMALRADLWQFRGSFLHDILGCLPGATFGFESHQSSFSASKKQVLAHDPCDLR